MEKFLQETIVMAGHILMEFFGRVESVTTKSGATDIVSLADLASQRAIIERIRQKCPHHGIVAEEEGVNEVRDRTWYIDPLDGTSNFVSRIPLFGVSMALLSRQAGFVEAGIYLPATDELFYAVSHGGASRNGKKMATEHKAELKNSFGCVPSRLTGRKKAFHTVLLLRSEHGFWLSSFGSTVVPAAYVADGRKDWLASFDNHPWDYAAAALILKESGCRVTNDRGTDWTVEDRELIAASPPLHVELMEMVLESETINVPITSVAGRPQP
ncbi:hypothetical protein A3I40_00375 [Candidatus Uhrbacteria bacterium RIFCSPLOWO2_02_FULL_48_12]|uniref:Inositol-phosphate phosphatase n=1 Tax=Candidatus Uhrbacteria bacterium RIFCSPLOWO2_02_FULL_48_12 TaxID=1802407 RepID=A0A1F7V615_9BACT|nr:MAG: hypothetical protein A3I40_00375 [Candidatus Uhrbacteria bacterium RIFCSPLOWO2_02_FULL_48_12]